MLNCSGGWKLIVTDIGRGPLAVNRRPRYHTATHGSPRPRAPDLGGGSRPRPDEDGGDRARRRRRGARAPSTARDRRDHRRGDGPRGARIVFPDVTKKPWAVRLTDEFRSGACHAGQYESSIVLAARPELVRETVRRSLPANPRSLRGAIRAGLTNFEQAGGPRAYFGSPAEARADEGAPPNGGLGAVLEEAVLAELGPWRLQGGGGG